MRFNDIIGQHAVKQRLLHSAQHQKISHAQLFVGPEGSGKLPLALAYAQYLNCKNPSTTDSCGRCPSCLKSQKLIHPDIHYSYPTIGPKATSNTFLNEWRTFVRQNPYFTAYDWLQHLKSENKQGNITAQECDAIVRKLSFTAYEGKFKVLIMWLPEYLGKEGNRLLKLIEEPPEQTLFLLLAENPEMLLNTILSRTQQLTIPRLSDAAIAQHLQTKHQIASTKSQQIAAVSEGNWINALQYITNSEQAQQQQLLSWLKTCLYEQNNQLLTSVETLAQSGRESQKSLLVYGLHFLRQSLQYKVLPTNTLILSKEETKLAQLLMQQINLNQFEKLVNQFENAYIHISRNANPRILFLHLSLQIMQLRQSK